MWYWERLAMKRFRIRGMSSYPYGHNTMRECGIEQGWATLQESAGTMILLEGATDHSQEVG